MSKRTTQEALWRMVFIGTAVGVTIMFLPAQITFKEKPDLKEIAVAVYTPNDPVVYYNPEVMKKIGPELAQFFVAHERAHILLRQTRTSPGTAWDKELAADCLAAAQLGDSGKHAALAAVRFFSKLHEALSEHPSGPMRAAQILACMPLSR